MGTTRASTTARAAVVGVLGALGTVAFLFVEHLLHDVVWNGRGPEGGAFETPVVAAVIVLSAAVVVGVLRRRFALSPPDPNFLDEMVAGRSPLPHALRLTTIGLVSLTGGASVGPEAPVATLGAGLGTAVAERDPDASADDVADVTFAGIAGVFGALLTFPFAAPAIALELQRDDRFGPYSRLLPGLVAAVVALAVLHPLLGTPFLAVYDVDPPPLRSWHLLAGTGLGLVGVVVGVVTGVAAAVGARAAAGVRDPLVRAVVGGLVLAGVALALPLTLFSGRQELSVVLDGGLGVGLLLATVVGKVVAFAVSMRFGFYGGAVFPLLFVGATSGFVVHELVPALPLAVAVTAVAAASTVVLVPLPLAVLVLVTLLFGLDVAFSAVPAAALVTAWGVAHGTGLVERLRRAGPAGRAAT